MVKPEGISVIAVLVMIILVLGAFILKKRIVVTSHLAKKTLQVEGNVEKGGDNMAME